MKDCFQGLNSELVHMEAHFWLVHLEQILKQLAQPNYALGVARYCLQLAQVLAVESAKDEVDFFPLV